MKNAFDPSTSTPADATKLIAQVAELLGLDDSASHDQIDDALDQLFAAVTGGATGAPEQTDSVEDPKVVDNSLTASERRACAAQGCSPRDFLAAKRAHALPNIGHVKASFKRGG